MKGQPPCTTCSIATDVSLSANDALDAWFDAAEESEFATAAYRALRRAISEWLPTDAKFGIGYQDEIPIILAMTPKRLFSVSARPPATEDEDHAVSITSMPLDAQYRIDLESRLEQTGRRGTWLVRKWSLAGPNTDTFTVLTRKPYGNAYLSDQHGDLVMSEVVQKLGWLIGGSSD